MYWLTSSHILNIAISHFMISCHTILYHVMTSYHITSFDIIPYCVHLSLLVSLSLTSCPLCTPLDFTWIKSMIILFFTCINPSILSLFLLFCANLFSCLLYVLAYISQQSTHISRRKSDWRIITGPWHLALPCLALPCLALPCLDLTWLDLTWLALPCLALHLSIDWLMCDSIWLMTIKCDAWLLPWFLDVIY